MSFLKLCSSHCVTYQRRCVKLVQNFCLTQRCSFGLKKKLLSNQNTSKFWCCRKSYLINDKNHCGRYFHTSQQRLLPPWLLLLYKFKFMNVLKGASVVVGRSGRKLYHRLPVKLQNQISRHRIVASCALAVSMVILYYSYKHYDICPLTGRKRWISFTREQILTLAEMDHKHLLETYQNKLIIKETGLYQICNSLVRALINHNSDIDAIKTINWNLNIVYDSETENAFVLPNGEIYLFTGMIELINNWEELAIILSHEMAHSILGHAQEQHSFLVFGELLVIPLLTFLWFMLEDFAAFIALAIENYLFPLVFQVGFNLPYSRQLEMEADVVGLKMASKACFDPRRAVFLWDKMALKEAMDSLMKGEKTQIEFLSSHPSHYERATTLEKRLEQMLKTRCDCGCPPLPPANPLKSAHKVRSFTTNIRKQVDLIEELNYIKARAKKGSAEKDAKAQCKLEKELAQVVSEYNAMLAKENIDFFVSSKSPTQSFLSVEEGAVRMRTDVIGDQFKTGSKFVNLSENNDTAEKHSLNGKSKRNYYSSIYF